MATGRLFAGVVVVAALASLGGCPGDCHCSIITDQLPGGLAGQSYQAQLEARVSCSYDFSNSTSNPAGPEWSVAVGSLPPGLSLSRGGMLAGVPTAPGTFQFSVVADCSSGLLKDKPTKEFSIVVAST